MKSFAKEKGKERKPETKDGKEIKNFRYLQEKEREKESIKRKVK